MSKKLMLVFITVLLLALSVGAISASDANDTSMSIQTSPGDGLDDVSDTNLYGTYIENTSSSSNDLSSDSDSEDVAADESGEENKVNTTFSAVNTTVLRTNYFNITLTDSSGNLLANQNVTFKLGSGTYNRTTDSRGMAGLKINLISGNYTVYMSYSGDSSYGPANTSYNLEVYEIPTTLSVLNTKVLRGNYYIVTLSDSYGNVLANQTVTIRVSVKTYTKTTNSAGVAVLRLTFAAKTYSIKTTFKAANGYKGITKTDSITVFQKASTLSVASKSVVKGNYLTVYLKDSSGAMVKQSVVLNLNSKKYTKTTDSSGAVKLKISLSPNTYTLKLSYAGDIAHKSTSKTVKLTVTSSTTNGQLAVSGSTKTVKGKTYSYSTSDKNTVVVKNGAKLTFTNGKIIKTGDVSSSKSESSDFYGTNAAVLVTAKSTLYLSDSEITTNAKGANAVFVTNLNSQSSGATAYVTNVVINTYKDKSRGLDATYGGKIIATNVTINTRGGSCAALATDRGEGTIVATNCVLNTGVGQTSGSGSPCIYSTGDITANKCTGTSYVSQIACIEGKNSITLKNCDLTGYGKGNRYVNGAYVDSCGVFLYQSMSGDAASGVSKFNAENSKLTISSKSSYYKSAPMFFVTNTQATITLKNTTLNFGSGILLKAAGQSQWGTSGSNGGKVVLNAVNQKLTGKIIIDKISTLKLTLTNSKYSGCINPSSSYGTTKVTVNSGSTWTLTGNSHVTSLSNAGTIVYGSYTLYVNGVAYTASNPYKG